MKFDACLSNRDCIFDSARFETAEEVLDWAAGRGGTYVLQVGTGNGPGLSFSVDSDGSYSRFVVCEWERLKRADVIDLLNGMATTEGNT